MFSLLLGHNIPTIENLGVTHVCDFRLSFRSRSSLYLGSARLYRSHRQYRDPAGKSSSLKASKDAASR